MIDDLLRGFVEIMYGTSLLTFLVIAVCLEPVLALATNSDMGSLPPHAFRAEWRSRSGSRGRS